MARVRLATSFRGGTGHYSRVAALASLDGRSGVQQDDTRQWRRRDLLDGSAETAFVGLASSRGHDDGIRTVLNHVDVSARKHRWAVDDDEVENLAEAGDRGIDTRAVRQSPDTVYRGATRPAESRPDRQRRRATGARVRLDGQDGQRGRTDLDHGPWLVRIKAMASDLTSKSGRRNETKQGGERGAA